MRARLACAVRELRNHQRLPQARLADQLNVDRSVIAALEGADASVSADRMIRALAVLGQTPEDIAKLLALDEVEIEMCFDGESVRSIRESLSRGLEGSVTWEEMERRLRARSDEE